MSAVKRALRQFTFGTGKTAGRNSSGRITSFHRGGGAKRLQRTIDVKRNDASSVGVVERIEYDPNRSSRIALVRWLHGVQLPPRRVTEEVSATPPRRRVLAVEPTTTATNIRGLFAFNSMLPPGNVGRETTPKDFFFSAFFSKAKVGASASESAPASESFSLGLPRMAVAGAKPVFFAPRVRGEEDTFRVRNWKRHSTVWAHRIKRKAAVSWHSKTL